MRVAVMGAGAIGGFYGAKLIQAGQEVHFLARGRNLAALRERGWRIHSYQGDFAVPGVSATDDPASLGPVDLVIIGVKSYDTEAAIATIRPLVGPQTIVFSLQNGVENEPQFAAAYGAERVWGGVAYVEAELLEPGLIDHRVSGALAFGDWVGSEPSARCRAVAALFESVGVPCQLVVPAVICKWTKLMINAALNPMTALTDCTMAEIMAWAPSAETTCAIVEEVYAVARAAGVPVPAAERERILGIVNARLPVRSSLWQDLRRGGRLEIDGLNGAVVRAGRAVGVPTPVNATLYGVLSLIDQRRANG